MSFYCLSGLYKIDVSIFEVPENAMKIQSQVKSKKITHIYLKDLRDLMNACVLIFNS